MREKPREGTRKDKHRGADPEEIATERGRAPEQDEENKGESIDDKDHTEFKDDRRERRRDRHE